jgi:hypothetical protein
LGDEGKLYAPSQGGPLRQGEILSDLIETRTVSGSKGQAPQVDLVSHPYVVVLSQDCDLDLDFQARNSPEAVSHPDDKLLPSVLLCQATSATDLRSHLSDSQIWKQITQNKNKRYQYLRSVPAEVDALGTGIFDLGIDFKRYFATSTEHVYLQLQGPAKRRSKLQSPYLEHLSSRFAYFLSRVALPEEHFAKKA